MGENTKIEWARHPVTGKGATWNPITGCRLVSEGCRHCYAARLAATRMKNHPSRKGLARANAAGEFKFTGEVRFNAEWLDQPLRWRAPRGIFVCAHGDLFAEGVPDDWIDKVFAVMALSPQHVFFVLTKRPERARAYIKSLEGEDTLRRCDRQGRLMAAARMSAPFPAPFTMQVVTPLLHEGADGQLLVEHYRMSDARDHARQWPLPNVWLGTSIEDQATADARVPELLATPAAIRFVSAEPLLGEVDFTAICTGHYFIDALRGLKYHDAPEGVHSATEACARLDWIITGGESGPHARPMHPAWARGLRDQCMAAGVPFLFKQWGEYLPVGQTLPGCGKVHGATAVKPNRMKLHYGGARQAPPQHAFADTGVPVEAFDDGSLTFRVGKKRSGRLLDGVEHNAMPGVAA